MALRVPSAFWATPLMWVNLPATQSRLPVTSRSRMSPLMAPGRKFASRAPEATSALNRRLGIETPYAELNPPPT